MAKEIPLKEYYEAIVEKYRMAFCKKQGFYFDKPHDCWVGGNIGSVGEFNDYYLTFEDIRYDIDNKIKKGVMLDYYNYYLDTHEKFGAINYASYCKGFRHEKNIDPKQNPFE